jgi:hypothetical protein
MAGAGLSLRVDREGLDYFPAGQLARFVRSGGAAADRVEDRLAPAVNAPLREGWSQVVRVA